MKRFAFSSLAFALLSVASHAASVTVSAPPSVSGSFDVAVDATNVFANFPDPTDGLIAFGFNVDVGSPLITFTGATVNSTFFQDLSGCCAGTDVVALVDTPSFELQAGDFTEPLLLATLHFSVNGAGSTTVGISADNSADLNQGLIFLSGAENFSDSARVTAATVTPEPDTMLIAGLSLAGFYAFRRRFSSK